MTASTKQKRQKRFRHKNHTPHKVVIVGGGFGGVQLALKLAKDKRVSVQLMSERPNFEYIPALYNSAGGMSPLEVVIPLGTIFEKYPNIELVLDSATKVDPNEQIVHTSTGNEYAYDTAVFALGQRLNYFGIEGMEENSFSLDNITNAVNLRNFLHKDLIKSEKNHLNFVVAGAGASGTELAGELSTYIAKLCVKHKVPDKRFDIILLEGSERVLPLLKPNLSTKVKRRLEQLGVKVLLDRQVTGRDNAEVVTRDMTIQTDVVVWTAGMRANPFLSDNPEAFAYGRAGRAVVDKHMQATKNIFVIGDSADTKYSGMAQTALYDAVFVSKQIKRKQSGKKLLKYKPKKPVYAIPVGPSWAVVQWGKFEVWGRPGWWLRRIADFKLFVNFEPLAKAVRTWEAGERPARETCPICRKSRSELRKGTAA